jgi:hypothetical protein
VPPPPARGVPLAAGLAALAVILAASALAVAVLRPSGNAAEPCQAVAWDALPDGATLPAGWSLEGSSFVADGYSTSFVGPAAPSASPATPSGSVAPTASAAAPSATPVPPLGATVPSVAVRVSCVGDGAEDAVTRAHDAALANGSTDVTFPDLGDESFATRDGAGVTTVIVRREGVVAYLVAASDVAETDLEAAATAQDEALATAAAGGVAALAGGNGIAASGPAVTPGPTDSGAADTSGADTTPHDVPALEALLPHAVQGTTLATQSTTGTLALGEDASSQALLASLQGLGKSAADLGLAEAYDDSGTLDLDLVAYQVKGVDATVLRQAIVQSWLAAGSSGITTAEATVGGKAVTTVNYGDGGQLDYLYARGDLVIDVATSDPALAGQVLSLLP